MSTIKPPIKKKLVKLRSVTGTLVNTNPGLLFILPLILVVAILLLYPVVNTFWLSVSQEGTFLGIQLYQSIFGSEWFSNVIFNSLFFVVVGVALQLIVGFGFAVLLNTTFTGRPIIRGLYLLPWITPGIVTALVWKWMYDPTFGIINHLLVSTGIVNGAIGWLSNPDLALFSLVIVALWKRFPFVMIMILAGLQDVDERLHHAAILDGAPWYARIRHVTIPQLMPVLKIVVLLSVIWTFNQFVIIFVATGGGPAGATNVLPVKVYELAFIEFRQGLATALSVVMLVIMLAFIWAYIRSLQRQGVEL